MNELNSLLLQGWKIKNETPTTYELQKNNSKIGFHILILFLLPLIGNLAYYFMSLQNKTILK